MLIMSLLAQALEEYILTPNYLLEDDDELRYILRCIANVEKKSILRGLLLSVSQEEEARSQEVKTKRISATISDAIGPLKALLPPETYDKLQSDLEDVLQKAISAWEPLQRHHNHYESNAVANRTNWEWKSVIFTGIGVDLETRHASAFEHDEAAMVVFPRVCAIDKSARPVYAPVFSGIVLQKSQLAAAEEEPELTEESELKEDPEPKEEPGLKEEPEPKEEAPEPKEEASEQTEEVPESTEAVPEQKEEAPEQKNEAPEQKDEEPEPKADPDPQDEPEGKDKQEPIAEPEPQADPEPQKEPSPQAEPEPHVQTGSVDEPPPNTDAEPDTLPQGDEPAGEDSGEPESKP